MDIRKLGIFEKFPQTGCVCPICETNSDEPCALIKVSGTTEGNICAAAPTHVKCILENLQYIDMFLATDVKINYEDSRAKK